MTSYAFPIKNGASGWISYLSLSPRIATGAFQTNPTLATGDVKVSIDGGALNNLGTLPTVTPAGGDAVKVTLSQAEINGDNIVIEFKDAAGAEWCDYCFTLQTVARGIDDLAYPATSGRSMVVDAAGLVDANTVKVGPTGAGTAQTARDIGASVLLSAGTGTGQLDFTSGVVKANLAQILGTALTETAGQISAAFKKVFDVAAATFTALSVNQTGDSYARIGATGSGLTTLATYDQVGHIAVTGAALNLLAASRTLTTGTETNTLASATAVDGVYHQLTDAAGTLDAYYQFDVGSDGTPVGATITGHLTSVAGSLGVFAYNWGTASWDQVGAIAARVDTADLIETFNLLTVHVGTGGNLGLVRVRFYGTASTTLNLYVDQIFVSFARVPVVLDAAGTRTAVGLATANLDTQLSGINSKTTNLPAAPAATGDIPTAVQNADALLDRANAVETGLTFRSALKAISAMLFGKVTGAQTGTEVFRAAVSDTKPRVTIADDSSGDRSNVTTDFT